MRTLIAFLLLTCSAMADISVSNVVLTTVQPTVVTNTATIKNAKLVWTSFSVNYFPPGYSNALYSITYFTKDMDTNKEVLNSRVTKRMSEKEVIDFAMALGIDFTQPSLGISYLVNEWLKRQVK